MFEYHGNELRYLPQLYEYHAFVTSISDDGKITWINETVHAPTIVHAKTLAMARRPGSAGAILSPVLE